MDTTTWAESKRRADEAAQRFLARTLVHHAKKQGLLVPTPCEFCGSEDNIHGHHKDYWKPLDVQWLCQRCHQAVHTRTDRPVPPPLVDLTACVAPLSPLPRRHLVFASYAAHYDSAKEIGKAMGISLGTVRMYVKETAARLPGTLPPLARICAWARGATLTVLQGHE